MSANDVIAQRYDEDKLAYYGAMQVWDDEGDLEPMLDFLRAETVKTWT